MLPANGLYGHIRLNSLKSLVLLAVFVLLIAGYWYAGCLAWHGLDYLFHPLRVTDPATGTFDHLAKEAWRTALARWHVPLLIACGWLIVAGLFYRTLVRFATGAKSISRRECPALYNSVERLAIAAGLPMPAVEVIETSALNAYASGLSPDEASIAVTRGLLKRLTPRELDAVLAHEITHIKNHDVKLMIVALVFTGGITLLGSLAWRMLANARSGGWRAGDFDVGGWSHGGQHRSGALGASGAPAFAGAIAALLVAAMTLAISHVGAIMTRFAISRAREFVADAGAVELTKDPDALMSALLKISGNDWVPGTPDTFAAMMISSSFDNEDFVEQLFSTHPTIEARIAALRQYAGARASIQRQQGEARPEPTASAVPSSAFGLRPARSRLRHRPSP